MLREAPQELRGAQNHLALSTAVGVVLPAERDALAIETPRVGGCLLPLDACSGRDNGARESVRRKRVWRRPPSLRRTSSSRIRWVSTVTEISFLCDQRYRPRSTDTRRSRPPRQRLRSSRQVASDLRTAQPAAAGERSIDTTALLAGDRLAGMLVAFSKYCSSRLQLGEEIEGPPGVSRGRALSIGVALQVARRCLVHFGRPRWRPVIAETVVERLHSRIYSFRRATTGSTRDARRAGTKQAKAATARRMRDTTVTVGT